jgi:hypothetical protein
MIDFVLSALFLPFVFKLAVPRGIPTECDEYEVASNYVDICRYAVSLLLILFEELSTFFSFCKIGSVFFGLVVARVDVLVNFLSRTRGTREHEHTWIYFCGSSEL